MISRVLVFEMPQKRAMSLRRWFKSSTIVFFDVEDVDVWMKRELPPGLIVG